MPDVVARYSDAHLVYDPSHIPNAPNGIWAERSLKLHWFSGNRSRRRQLSFQARGQAGWTLFGGKGRDDTMATIEALGLHSSYYDSTLDEITNGEAVLGFIPLEAWGARENAKLEEQNDLRRIGQDKYIDDLSRIPGVTPRVYEDGEFEDRKESAKRAGTRVGYTGRAAR